MPEDINNKIKQELRDLPNNSIVMLETSADKSLRVTLETLNVLTTKANTLVLSASRPCTNVLDIYKKAGINPDKIFILCCVCGVKSLKYPPNIIHAQGVNALTEISISLAAITKKFQGNGFLVIDSISTMLIHNDAHELARFIHGILTRLRTNNIGGVVISIEEQTDKAIRAEITQLCDNHIKI